jgi:Glycosyl transferase family 2
MLTMIVSCGQLLSAPAALPSGRGRAARRPVPGSARIPAMASLPTVSALMAAYNYEEFVGRAIQSALDQDYPPELLEVVVIDDGSTDSTADIVRELAARNPGRVRLVQQANGGYVAATNRALAEGRGDLLALLDADDMWLPGKTRRQVEMLADRPELGMVFSDMVVVDGEEQTVRPSLIWHLKEIPERAFARVLWENVATQSAIMIRSSLRDAVAPIPPDITYADWWITLRSVQFSRIDFSREPLALYRVHGANLTADVSGAGAVREARKGIAFQLWAMRNLPVADHLTPDEMVYVWANTEDRARKLMEAAGSFFVELVPPSPEHAALVPELLAAADRLRDGGDVAGEAGLALRALACDPFRPGARERLDEAVARAQAAAQAPDPLQGATGFVVLVAAEDLLGGDDLLTAYAGALGGAEGVTLAIDATRMAPDAAGADLQALVERCGLAHRDDVPMVAVVGERSEAERHRMLGAIHAVYRREPAAGERVPVFTPESLPDLRELARSAAE